MEKTSQIREIVETAVINLKQAAEVNTIIGKPIMTEQGTIMPVSQMTFAFVAGGGEYGNGSANRTEIILQGQQEAEQLWSLSDSWSWGLTE